MLENTNNHDKRIITFKKIFEELKIEIPYFSIQAEKEKMEEKRPERTIPPIEVLDKTNISEQDDDWCVPAEIKAKILALLKNNDASYAFDTLAKESKNYDPFTELKDGKIKIYSIGGNKSGLFGYISPHANTNSPEEAARFKKVLKEGRLLPKNSQGISGIKPLTNGKFSNKPSDMDRRMLTNRMFMADRALLQNLRVNIDITDEVPSTVKILRFGPVKNHAQLNN